MRAVDPIVPKLSAREQVKLIFHTARAAGGIAHQGLATSEVRASFERLTGQPLKGASKHIAVLADAGFIRRVTRGVHIWNDAYAVQPAKGLFPPDALPPRAPLQPAETTVLVPLRVPRKLWDVYATAAAYTRTTPEDLALSTLAIMVAGVQHTDRKPPKRKDS